MIADHGLLHRVSFHKKSIYCGYSQKDAAKKYYETEPEATEENPLEWHLIVVEENPLNQVAKKLLRRAPGPDRLTEEIDAT